MPRFVTALLSILLLASPALAGAIYPIDRAVVLAGSRFDLKVEFDQVVPQDQIQVTVGVTRRFDWGKSDEHRRGISDPLELL